MAIKSIIAADRRQAQANILETSTSQTSQAISITDIVSEGEIKGLVNGGESIFFAEDSLFSNDESNFNAGFLRATGAVDSTNVTLSGDTKQTLTGGNRFLAIKNALTAQVSLSNGSPLVSGSGTKFTLTASSAIFLTQFQHDTGVGMSFDLRELAHGDGVFFLDTLSKGGLRGTISEINEAGTTCVFRCPDSDFEEFESETSGTRTLLMDLYLKIASISSTAITLTANPALAFTDAEFEITESVVTGNSGKIDAKYPGSRYQIALGTQTQKTFNSGNGQGSVTVGLVVPAGGMLKRGSSAVTITGSTTLAGGQAAEVDEVTMIFTYPSGISHAGGSKGKIHASAVAYRVEVGIKRGSESVFSYERLKGNVGPDVYSTTGNDIGSGNDSSGATASGEFVLAHTPRGRKGETTQRPLSTEVSIDLATYQPFTDFQIKVTRLTNHGTEDGGVNYTGPVASGFGDKKIFHSGSGTSDYNENSPASISNCTAYIKEKLNYPFTAMINTQFNSQQFGSVPKRSYELYGIKLQVPSNYVTREENGDTGLEAIYTRSPSTGLVTATNQPWDGNFRAEKVYSNNPAWVFYDILVSNRYGLGGFVKQTNIDKFSLYKIAKYCDELVPDGKGALEPRFTANLYLQKATDAYKVLKDMATIFRGMLYWINGEVRPVIDEKKSPVYNFSKANVLDGKFSFESTGSKTRANQYVVTWNNPEAGYKLEPLIIEDKQNIAETGRIISQTATAFGCTSEGQALRYGRWKLWTSVNQTDIASFATGEGAAFLVPGDVVNIQDADEYDIPFSGRVNSYTESGAPLLTLDRDIDVYLHSTDYTYTISVIVPKTISILNQDTATIGSVAYSRGDTIVQARLVHGGGQATIVVANPDTTSLNANNALDDSNAHLHLVLRDSTIVQERALTGSHTVDSINYTLPAAAVDGRTTVQLVEALDENSASDLVETLWVIKQVQSSSNKLTASSPKQYKIISVSEGADGTYEIVAVEHYNEKFDSIENDFVVAVDDPVYPPEPMSTPPAPTGLRILRVPERTIPGEEIIVQWDAPTYGHIKGYEITHFFNKERADEIRELPSTETQISFGGIEEGRYTIAVRSISNFNKRSKPVSTEISILDIFSNNVPRINGLQKGCISTSAVQMTLGAPPGNVKTDGIFFANGSYAVAPLSAVEGDGYINVLKTNNTSNANSIAQLVTEISQSDWRGEFTTVGNFAHVFYDFSRVSSSSEDPMQLVSWVVDKDLGVSYWYDADLYAADTTSIWTALAGTTSIAVGTNKVIGVGTSFSSLYTTSVVKFSSSFAANVAFIESDTVMYISAVPTTAIASGTTAYRDQLNPDYRNDFLLGEASYISSKYNFTSYADVKKDQIDDARGIAVTSNIPVISYNGSSVQQTDYSTITLSIDTLNYTNPEIKVTGTGYNQTASGAETGFITASSREVIVHPNATDIPYSSGATLDFVVEARERNNISRTRTKTYSITKTIDDIGAGSGFTATVSNLDHTFRMNSVGTILSNNYLSVVSVFKGGSAFTYAASGSTGSTYGATFGGFDGVGIDAADNIVSGSVNNNLTVQISSSESPIYTTPTILEGSFTITIFDRGNSNATIGVFTVLLKKEAQATRGGQTLTLIMTQAQAVSFKGTLSDSIAREVATAVISHAGTVPDGTPPVKRIVNNDRITVKHTTAGGVVTVSTRIFNGSPTAIGSSVNGSTAFWSVPVVKEFDGSVIVDGTLSANTINGGSITGGTVTVSNDLVLGAGGKFYTPNKSSFTDTDNGFFLDTEGNFALGGTVTVDGVTSTNSLVYNAGNGNLTLSGNFSLAGPTGVTPTLVYIYKKSSSASGSTTWPTGTSTYTFASQTLAFTNHQGWAQTVPVASASQPYIYRLTGQVTPASNTIAQGTAGWGYGELISGSAGINGLTGGDVNLIFKRAAAHGGTPSASAGVPTGWFDSPPATPVGGLLWASAGSRAAYSSSAGNYVWTTPYQIEGAAHAEVYIYRKNSSAGNSGGSYNFTNNTLDAPTGWDKNPQTLTTNGDIIYVSVGLASGASTATAAPVTYGTPAAFSKYTVGPTSTVAGPAGTAFYQISSSSWGTGTAKNSSLIIGSLVLAAVQRYAVKGDIAVVNNPNWVYAVGSQASAGFKCTLSASTTDGSGATWVDADVFISGDLIVSNTIGADKIVTNAISSRELLISNTTGNDRVEFTSTNINIYNGGNLRIKIGAL